MIFFHCGIIMKILTFNMILILCSLYFVKLFYSKELQLLHACQYNILDP